MALLLALIIIAVVAHDFRAKYHIAVGPWTWAWISFATVGFVQILLG